MLSNVLPTSFGGRSKGIFRRANIGAELGYDIEVLFCGFQYHVNEQVQVLKERGEVHRDVKVTQWLDDLRADIVDQYYTDYCHYKQPIDLSQYEVRATKKNDNIFSLYKHSVLDSKVKFNVFTKKIERIDDLVKGSHKISARKFYDKNGYLLRQIIFFPVLTADSQRRRKELYYNVNGTVFLEVDYVEGENKSEVKEITYKNGRYADFKCTSWSQMRGYWLKNKVKKNSVMTLSARKLDATVIEAELDKKDVNLIFWLHNEHSSKSYQTFLNYNKESMVISLTEEQKLEIAQTTEHKLENIKVFKQSYRHAKVCEDFDRKKLVIVSRFSNKQKNLLAAIRGFAEFYKTNQDFSLDIWGFGGDQQAMEKCISELGMEKVIIIRGITNDAADKFANAAAFLITSHYEGLGKTIIESIACGCPVAAHDFKYGPRSFIKEGENGYIDTEMTDESYARIISQTVAINERYTRMQIAASVASFEEVLEDEKEFFAQITQ